MTNIEEYNDIIEVCKKFFENRYADSILDADLNSNTDWVKSVWKDSTEISLPGLIIPEEYGGIGQSVLCCALILDLISSECSGLASVYANHFTACVPLLFANEEQKKMYLSSSGIGSIVFPPDVDEDFIYLREKGDKLILSGTSPLFGNSSFFDWVCIFAREANNNISCIILDKRAQDLAFSEDAKLPGLKVNPFKQITFNKTEIKPESIIGERGQAKRILEESQSAFMGFISGMAIGAARCAFRKAHSYAQERFQYGDMIINHQEIRRMLGEMLGKLGTGTASYIHALTDGKINLNYSALDPMLAKAFCTEQALQVAIDAIQVHGGYGYMHEYGVEKIMRDVKVLSLMGGRNPLLHIKAVS